jgi:ADP-ribose pyrophosphatase YjhB (NUDIX family)
MIHEKDLYFVAVKVFLEDSNSNLLITKDRFCGWDLPGGRLREIDFDVSLEDVVERKIQEELGGDVRYELGDPIVFMRHERDEILSSGEKEKRRIFAVGYRADYLGGEICLGSNHVAFEWVSKNDFDPEQYFTGGWLKGVREYLQKIQS